MIVGERGEEEGEEPDSLTKQFEVGAFCLRAMHEFFKGKSIQKLSYNTKAPVAIRDVGESPATRSPSMKTILFSNRLWSSGLGGMNSNYSADLIIQFHLEWELPWRPHPERAIIGQSFRMSTKFDVTVNQYLNAWHSLSLPLIIVTSTCCFPGFPVSSWARPSQVTKDQGRRFMPSPILAATPELWKFLW